MLILLSVTRPSKPSPATVLVSTVATNKNTTGISSSPRKLTLTKSSTIRVRSSSNANELPRVSLIGHMPIKTAVLPSSEVRAPTVIKIGRNTGSSQTLVLS